MEKFKGVFPALLTPFNMDDKINEKVLEKLIELNIKKGVNGFYVGGSTAEVFLLSEEERTHLYKLVKDIVGNRATLIAHIGAISTKEAITYGKIAETLGYDAISSVAPFYYKFSFGEIKKYYFDIVDSVNLPMVIYNFPNFSGVTLTADNIGEFLSDSRFIGVKHTSNDYFAMEQFKSRYPDKIVYNGFDEMFLAGLSMGADGGIGSTYNFMAEKFIDIYNLFKAGKLVEAQSIQKEANRIITALCKVGVMQGEKAILDMMGLDFGKARSPFRELATEELKYLENEVKDLL